MARWIRLSRADWLHLNKLLQRDQRRRDQAHERYCQQHGGQAPRQARKMFGTLQPACVVDLHTGAMYAVASEAGWWWQSVDERQFAWWFYLGPEERVVLKADRPRRTRPGPVAPTVLDQLLRAADVGRGCPAAPAARAGSSVSFLFMREEHERRRREPELFGGTPSRDETYAASYPRS